MTPTERGDLAERMLPIAAGLACITHGDGDQRDIAHLLNKLSETELRGLAVVLASLVDPDLKLRDALGHVTWDETGRPSDVEIPGGTLRGIAVRPEIASGSHELLLAENKHFALVANRVHGTSHRDIAEQLDVAPATVTRWLTPAA